jgi:hypothetical protein
MTVTMNANRKALAALTAERDIAMDAAKAETEGSAKLGTIHAAVEPARAALIEFDAQQALGFSNWAKGLTTGRPKSDAARRASLAAKLADAELASAAAKAAQDEIQANVERISASLPGIAFEARKLAKIIAVEEAEELLPKIVAAIATAESLRFQLEAAQEEAGSGIPFGAMNYGDVNKAVERFDVARRAAESRPIMPPVNPFADGWRKFTAALTQDASVDFDGAQQMDVGLAPVHKTTIDPVSAAARAVEAFSSNGFVR